MCDYAERSKNAASDACQIEHAWRCQFDGKYSTFYGRIASINRCAIFQLIFFDGEEAFKDWTQTDSLYGSRHLADKWELASTTASNARLVDQVEALVLLDLIGAANPKFYSFFENTEILHTRLIAIERYLHEKKFITSRNYMFLPQISYAAIDDDHRPFLTKSLFNLINWLIWKILSISSLSFADVPVLHLIPNPFPKDWHKITDNMENLSMPTIKNFMKILRVFVADYFSIHDPTTSFRD